MRRRSGALIILLSLFFLLSLSLSLSSAQQFGQGWIGVFYNNRGFAEPATATISNISGLNFNWPGVPVVNGIAVPGIGADNFSARFTSTQQFTAGTHRFTVTFDDRVRVLIDGQQVFEGIAGPVRTESFEHQLSGGAHNITVEFIEFTDVAILQFQWGSAGPPPTAGPSPTPEPTSTPAPTSPPAIPAGALSATVIRATVLNVRSAPSLGAARVSQVRRGQTYAVIGRDANARWFLLQLSNGQGWAWGHYLAVNGNEFNAPVVSSFLIQGNPAALTGVVAQTNAVMKLRAEPTTNSAQIGRIPWGDVIGVTGQRGSWWRVNFRGTDGWVYSDFLTIIEGNLADVPIVE